MSQLGSEQLTQSEGEADQKGIDATAWSACRTKTGVNIIIECCLVTKLLLDTDCQKRCRRLGICYNSVYCGKYIVNQVCFYWRKSSYHIPTKYFLSIVLLLFTHRSLLSYRFPQQNYLCSTRYIHVNYTSSQKFHDFTTLTVIGKLHISWSSSLCNIFHSARPLWQTLCIQTLATDVISWKYEIKSVILPMTKTHGFSCCSAFIQQRSIGHFHTSQISDHCLIVK